MSATPAKARAVVPSTASARAPAECNPGAWAPEFAAFNSVPPRHGVALLQGQVVVYDENDLHRNELQAGAFYVIEYQRPRSGLSWAQFRTIDDRRVDASREVVRVVRRGDKAEHWWLHHAQSRFVSGPLLEFNLTDMIVGKVVGIYRPGADQ